MHQTLLERIREDVAADAIPKDIMALQDEVSDTHRSMLVDWLIEVVEVSGTLGLLYSEDTYANVFR